MQLVSTGVVAVVKLLPDRRQLLPQLQQFLVFFRGRLGALLVSRTDLGGLFGRIAECRCCRLRAVRQADNEFNHAERDAVAIVQVDRVHGPAVDRDDLHGREFAQAHAAGVTGDKAENGGKVGGRQAEVAAGHGADEKAAVTHFVHGRPPVLRAHFEVHRRRGCRDCWFHTDYPRGVVKPSGIFSGADWNQSELCLKGQSRGRG